MRPRADHVEAPGLVMVAGAGVRALHSAVTGQEGAAAAEGEAVLSVVTDQERRGHRG